MAAASSDAEPKHAWVKRVLGVDVALSLSAARGAEAATVSKGAFAFGKMQLRWRESQSRVQASLQQLADALLSHPGIKDDPRFPQVKAVAGELTGLVPKFSGELETVLDAAANEGRLSSSLAGDGAALIAQYRAKLADAPELKSLERFAGTHFRLDMKLYSDLDETLAALSSELVPADRTATGA